MVPQMSHACSRHDQVDVLSITDAGAGPRICWLQTINDVGQLRFLRGHHIGVTLVHNINVPCVIEWPSHSIRHLRCSPDTEVSQPSSFLESPYQ